MSVRFCPAVRFVRLSACPSVRFRLSAARWRYDKWSPGRSPLRIRPQKHGLYNGHFLATFPADFFYDFFFLLFCGSCCSQFFVFFFSFFFALLTNHSMRVCVCVCVWAGWTKRGVARIHCRRQLVYHSFSQAARIRRCRATSSGTWKCTCPLHFLLSASPSPVPATPTSILHRQKKKGRDTNPNHLINQSICVLFEMTADTCCNMVFNIISFFCQKGSKKGSSDDKLIYFIFSYSSFVS